MKRLSPTGLPPSAAPMVMPGTVRRASVSETAPVCAIVSAVTTVTDFGVSSSGAVNLSLAETGLAFVLAPVTCTVGMFWSIRLSGAAWADMPSVASMANAGAACLRLLLKDACLLFLVMGRTTVKDNENDSHYDSC